MININFIYVLFTQINMITDVFESNSSIEAEATDCVV